jgi:hypothetical protein
MLLTDGDSAGALWLRMRVRVRCESESALRAIG